MYIILAFLSFCIIRFQELEICKIYKVLACKPRVTVSSCFVYKVIMDLSLIDHLCIIPIHRIGLIHK